MFGIALISSTLIIRSPPNYDLKDHVDPDKLQAIMMDNNLNEACDLKGALEMSALLEVQLKELNPNLDSIAE
ncbi:hypothetical protein YC2023_019821 [Brassica napus]